MAKKAARVIPGREKQTTYRTTHERHRRLKSKANDLDIDIQELLDNAVDAYLSPENADQVKPKELMELHAALDALWGYPNVFPYEVLLADVRDALQAAVRNPPEKYKR